MQLKEKIFYIILIFLSTQSVSSQSIFDKGPFNPFLDTIGHNNFLSVDFRYQVNSNAITNEFTYPFLFGGYIDNNLKNQVSPRLKARNRAGFILSTEINYRHNTDTTHFFSVGVRQQQFLHTLFAPDMFELIFRGNKQFAGKTATLHPFRYRYFDFQALALGAGKKINKNLTVAAEVSILRGGRFQEAVINHGTLYTEENGAYIDLNLDYHLTFTDRNTTYLSEMNGIGIATGFSASYNGNKFKVTANVRDLGVMRWMNLNHLEGDSSYRFEGKEIEDVLVLDNSVFDSFKADSLAKNLGFEKRKENNYYFLPTFIHINYVYYFSRKFYFYSGIEFIVNANYLPRLSLGPVYRPEGRWRITPVISIGGFGKADFSLAVEKFFGKGFYAAADLFIAEALIADKRTAGHGINLELIKAF